MPEIFRVAFEAEERVVGRTAALVGIVADPGLLLFAVQDHDGGVQIEDEPRARGGLLEPLLQQPIVQLP